MSDIKYGLISETDARCLEKTLDLILKDFDIKPSLDFKLTHPVKITEIGLFDCGTTNGIFSYLSGKCAISYTGIDNNKDKWIIAPEWINFINGNSNEVYNQIPDESQHLIFIDGCHCFAHVVSDFFCYAPKVKVGGYIAFHDTGKHIKPFKDFQHGDKENPDAYISVRKALTKLGLFGDLEIYDVYKDFDVKGRLSNWKLIFDEADETNEAGGICVFKKRS